MLCGHSGIPVMKECTAEIGVVSGMSGGGRRTSSSKQMRADGNADGGQRCFTDGPRDSIIGHCSSII